MAFENTYQPPISSFLYHRFKTNPNHMIEALFYTILVGIIIHFIMQTTTFQTVFYAILAIIFFYALLSTNNKALRKFIKKVQIVAINAHNRTNKKKN